MAGEQAGLQLEQPAVAESVVQQRVGDLLCQTAFEGFYEIASGGGAERDAAGGAQEVVGLDLAVVDAWMTQESAMSGRNGSMRSSARAGRP